MLRISLFVALLVCTQANAKSLVGTWQGNHGADRLVFIIERASDGNLRGKIHELGIDTGLAIVSAVQVDGKSVKFDVDDWPAGFEGKLLAGENTMAGNWITGQGAAPITFERATTQTAWPVDSSSHKTSFVSVERNVQLEVLDYGGKGPPLILLTGLGNSAHVFDTFALRFVEKHRVFAISRRGYGASSRPEPSAENYSAVRLGEDVIAVMDALKIEKPVVAGHSIGGSELSYLATRHPERVAGLVYLEAAYGYALFSPDAWGQNVTISEVRAKLEQLFTATPSELRLLVADIESAVPNLLSDLHTWRDAMDGAPDTPRSRLSAGDRRRQVISTGGLKHTSLEGPVLAIMGVSAPCKTNCESLGLMTQARIERQQIAAFERAVPQARVVKIVGGSHLIFASHEDDVVREMNSFMDELER